MARDDIDTIWKRTERIRYIPLCDVEGNEIQDVDNFTIIVGEEEINTIWTKS